MHLPRQVQILQLEYLGRIQPEHVEEVKHDCFFEGLNPEYWWILAHKVDGENPAGYSDLLLATWKLERRTEARDPLPPKTAVPSGSNAIHSQTPGNLFPLHRLKGNHTFTAWVATIWNDEVEADSSMKQEGETEPSAEKEVKVSGRAGGTDQPKEYIVCFTQAVKLYQQKNKSYFGCQSPDHLVWDCLKDMSKSAWIANLNT